MGAGVPDTSVPDTSVADASVSDTGVSGAGGFELVPGVSSPSAAAAAAGVCLALGRGGVAVIAGGSPGEITDAVEKFETVVIIKPSPAVTPFVREKGLDFVYCRDLGGAGELVTESPEDITDEKFPYFSLFIVSKGLNRCRET